MRLYLDTEYNGFGGELISMAIVSPAGHRWYGARAPVFPVDPWVAENVMPKLEFGRPMMTDREFRDSLHVFLHQFDDPEIVCDWHADAGLFCSLLQGETFDSSLDYACRITILRTPPGQPVSEIPHNAVADAEALMRWNEARLTNNG